MWTRHKKKSVSEINKVIGKETLAAEVFIMIKVKTLLMR